MIFFFQDRVTLAVLFSHSPDQAGLTTSRDLPASAFVVLGLKEYTTTWGRNHRFLRQSFILFPQYLVYSIYINILLNEKQI